MKKFIISLCLIAVSSAFAGILPKGTVYYYEANYPEFVNKEIRLDVTHLTPRINVDQKLKKGLRCFIAHVHTGEYNGGSMTVMVPQSQVPSMLKRYGIMPERSKGKTKTFYMKGTLKMDENGSLYMLASNKKVKTVYENGADMKDISELKYLFASLSTKNQERLMKYAKKLSDSKSEDEEEETNEEEGEDETEE